MWRRRCAQADDGVGAGAATAGRNAATASSAHRGGQQREEAKAAAEHMRGGLPVDGLAGCIGGTPMIELKSLSKATGCRILGKAEFLNPGGSSKDRVARQMVIEAEDAGLYVVSPIPPSPSPPTSPPLRGCCC